VKGSRAILLGVGGLAVIGAVSSAAIRRGGPTLPTTAVARGTFSDYLTLRGDIRPVRSIALTAPSSGGDLQIIDLLKGGTPVKPGDVVIRFDASVQERTLQQKRSELKQAEANIEKAEADQRKRVAASHADVEQNRSVLERARLDLAKTEISSRIDAEKLKAAVIKAEAHLRAAQQIETSERDAAAADVVISRQKRDKALADVQDSERTIAALTMKAPAAGTVSLLPNQRAGGGFGRSAPEFRRGDRAWFGAPIAELPDLSVVQMNCRLEEADRARVQAGAAVTVRTDAVPDRELKGRIKDISTVAKPDFTTWPPVRNFDVVIALADTDARLRPGMNASARIELDQLHDVLVLPAGAVFQAGGASIVYAAAGNRVDARPITVVRRSREQVVVSGSIHEGDRVSLKEPDAEGR